MMKKNLVLPILILLIAGCYSERKYLEVNADKLNITDTFNLGPHLTDKMVNSVDNPTRGKIEIILSNYSDSDKIFLISVKEQ